MHDVEHPVESGRLKDYATAARLLGVTRSRMAQIVGLLGLSAGIQSGILIGEIVVGERAVRGIAREVVWRSRAPSNLPSLSLDRDAARRLRVRPDTGCESVTTAGADAG